MLLLGSLARRLRGRHGASPAQGGAPASPSATGQDPLQVAGRCLRSSREERGLSLRQLAMDTRVSTAVLEALERGWRERLPEAAYLRTMLPLLEQHLQLPANSLAGALPPQWQRQQGPRRQPLVRRFTPGSIDVFTSWQGTLLYGGLTLLLIYALNLQQQRLARQGLLDGGPISASSAAEPARAAGGALLRAYPDLRPLRRAAQGQGLSQLRQEEGRPSGRPLPEGRLSLELPNAATLEWRSAGGEPTRLSQVSGQLELPLRPPFELQISPAAAGGSVAWNGTPLAASGDGRFRYPPAAPAASGDASGPRP
jgi:transcriptional regulator with XRE-family HTH domain